MKILITSGGTKVPIDSVRHIGNMSSGTFGAKIGHEALKAGHDVTFFHAKGSKTPLGLHFDGSEPILEVVTRTDQNIEARARFDGRIRLLEFTDFSSYEAYMSTDLGMYDMVILAAAVSDYDVANKVDGKIRSKGDMTIDLKPLPKIIAGVRQRMRRLSTLVGFKLLVGSTKEQLIEAANKSIVDNGCDMVVANDLCDIKANNHTIRLVTKDYDVITRYTKLDEPNYLARVLMEEATWVHNQKG